MRAIVLSVLLGCGATTGHSSGQPLECGAVISNLLARSQAVVDQVWANQRFDPTKQLADALETVRPVIVESCRADRWSVDLLECLDGMAVTDDPHKCNHLFTTEQAVGLARRTIAVMTQRARRD
jgi:hypothetical protein